MTIDCAFFGTLGKDPERKSSKSGRQYLGMNVRTGDGEDAQWIYVLVFNDVEQLVDSLKSGSRVYCEGTLKADIWDGGNSGKPRVNLSVMSWLCQETHRIGRNKPKRGAEERPRQAAMRQTEMKLQSPRSEPTYSGPVYDDDIPL
jgi:single-stranded DNA-binding protein